MTDSDHSNARNEDTPLLTDLLDRAAERLEPSKRHRVREAIDEIVETPKRVRRSYRRNLFQASQHYRWGKPQRALMELWRADGLSEAEMARAKKRGDDEAFHRWSCRRAWAIELGAWVTKNPDHMDVREDA